MSDEYADVQFDDKKSFSDWGLKLERISLSFPEPKLDLVDIPGADGSADLTEVNGPVCYENRTITLTFSLLDDYVQWHLLASEIAAELHGQNKKCILPDDQSFYYYGRFTLETEKDNDVVTDVVITGNVEPYKLELQSSLDDWLWDPFNFEEDIIREYGEIEVDGTTQVNIIGRQKPSVPTIISDADMTVSFEGATYEITPGTNIIYDIVTSPGDNVLTFSGTGTISIDYRGGIL